MKKGLLPRGGNDEVWTPDPLAKSIVAHFAPQIAPGSLILEPCAGEGAFVRAFRANGLTNITELELTRGQDFFDHEGEADWIITNPPWSKCRDFLRHSYEIAPNVVFLITVNHITALKGRLRDMAAAGYGIKEIFMVPEPPAPWPSSGFQLAAHHLQRGWTGPTVWSRLGQCHGRGKKAKSLVG